MYYEVLWKVEYEKATKNTWNHEKDKIKPEKKSAGKIIDLLNSSTDCKD